MREGKVIIPITGNSGECLSAVHTWLARGIIKMFGGVTVTEGVGAWINPDTGVLHNDPVKVFHVAATNSTTNNDRIRSLAILAGGKAREHAVYFVGFDGNVSIENTTADIGFGPELEAA